MIRNLGFQLRQVTFLGRESTRFVDKDTIRQVIINEGVLWHSVIYYVAFVINGHDRLTLAFSHLYPRLPVVLRVYRATKLLVDNANRQ